MNCKVQSQKTEPQDIEVFDKNHPTNPYGLLNIHYMNVLSEDYLPWFALDEKALGFQICKGKYEGVFIFIDREKMKLEDNKLTFDFRIIKNPYSVPKKDLESEELLKMINRMINETLTKVWNWEERKKTNDTTSFRKSNII
jgi:hypothetical protein